MCVKSLTDTVIKPIRPYLFPTSDPTKLVLVLDGGSSDYN